MTKRKIKFIVVFSLLILAVYLCMQLYLALKYSAKIDLLYTPTSSIATLDGKNIKAGITRVRPGVHTLQISKDGFASHAREVEVNKGEMKFFGVILESDSQSTADWYENNADDQRIREAITSIELDQLSARAAKLDPIVKILPYYAPGGAFEIGVGVADPKTGRYQIVITTHTETAEEDAKTWIRSSGYDPEKMKLKIIPQIHYRSSPAGDSVLYDL